MIGRAGRREVDMALLASKRRNETESPSFTPSFTRSVDAALGFVEESRRVPGEFVQDLFLALGVIAETLDTSTEIRGSIAEGLTSVADRAHVPTREIFDRLLDLRSSAAQVEATDGV
jgi:hypothetical protein